MVIEAVTEIFGTQKEFSSRWVGSPRLNRWGLHRARIGLADAALGLRRLAVKRSGPPLGLATLERDGVLVVEDVLPVELFRSVRDEARASFAAAAELKAPPRQATSRGFGSRQSFLGGFDRFDGDTLNRFLDITERGAPAAHRAVRDARLAALCRAASGFNHQPHRFSLYLTVAGDNARNPDPQRDLHRDTFYSSIKLWLFLEDVALEDGPFEYVVGSHRMNPLRFAWERQRALDAAQRRGSGSFRIEPSELAALGLDAPKPFPVRQNTLVIADVRGFHRRGAGRISAARLAIYANLRTKPFSPFVV